MPLHLVRPNSPPCHYCPKPATKLCDYAFSPERTCDRPLCAQHAVSDGVLFVCGDEGSADTIDYCREHHAQIRLGIRKATEIAAKKLWRYRQKRQKRQRKPVEKGT